MKFLLPFVIAIIVASAVSGKIHATFSSGLATAIDILVYFAVFFITYKAMRYLREL